MTSFRTLDAAEFKGKRVLVRVDLNVPTKDGVVTDDTRIRAVLPTIREISDKGGRVILLAHFGRPKGERVPEMSLSPVVPALEQLLGRKVAFADDCIGNDAASAPSRRPSRRSPTRAGGRSCSPISAAPRRAPRRSSR